ncbi:hypothetical protein GGQ84_000475 [Desulfitispora alkaliphila]|uniref:rubredoxin-like domain-containing protein n=1 Tax=Desulfitispora alkaliphila TaxID=622674 RepID=UPI003D197125
MWQCEVCNYITYDEDAPEKCPKCGAPKEKFAQLPDEQVDKIERSAYTNDLLMQLNTVLNEVAYLSEEGIEDELDPGCVKVFKEALETSEFLQQSIKAEIQTHISKGKWG